MHSKFVMKCTRFLLRALILLVSSQKPSGQSFGRNSDLSAKSSYFVSLAKISLVVLFPLRKLRPKLDFLLTIDNLDNLAPTTFPYISCCFFGQRKYLLWKNEERNDYCCNTFFVSHTKANNMRGVNDAISVFPRS